MTTASDAPITAILDYGCGNLRSVAKALEYIGGRAVVTNDPAEATAADRIILPGVGAFQEAMRLLLASGLDAALRDAVERGKPTLGICLGMQMLMSQSEEYGVFDGLGYFPARITRFPAAAGKVPHMGWNTIAPDPRCPLFSGLNNNVYVYFVHSYRVSEVSPEWTAATARYGGGFTAAVWRGNLFGTQFHPEKSGEAGLRILRNFVALPLRQEGILC